VIIVLHSIVGFVPEYEIGSNTLCQSESVVSPKHTGIVSENGENLLRNNYVNSIKAEKCRRYDTFLMLVISPLTSTPMSLT